MSWQCFSIRHIYKIMFVIFNLDKILNPVVEAGEPIDAAVPMEEIVENYDKLHADNTDKTRNMLRRGSY